jgi:putative hydrolase of the HAD superfamily
VLSIREDVSDEQLAVTWKGIFSRTKDNERVIATLRSVSQTVTIVLASNTNELHFQAIESGWADLLCFLNSVVVSFRVGYRKPARDFYLRVLEAAGSEPAETLFIDDRADLVAAAVALGMHGLQYSRGMDLAGALAAFNIDLTADRGQRASS